MTTTAGDQINGAMRLLNILDQDDTADATQLANGLTAFDQMIDSWNTERLSVFSTQDQTFTWPASTTSRTLGPTGNFVGNRPILLDDSTYFKSSSGVSYGIEFINQEQYDGIALKSATSTFPQVMFINMGYPDITMYLYPVPTVDLEFHFISVEELTQPATSGTTLSLPPGYLRAFRYNLALEIAAEYGIQADPRVVRIADISKRNLKRINNPNDLMSLPAAMVIRRPRFNIYSGNM